MRERIWDCINNYIKREILMKRSNPILNILTAILAASGGCAAVLSGFIVLHALLVGDFGVTDGESVSSEATLIQESDWPEDSSTPVTHQEETSGLELPTDIATTAVEEESEVYSIEEQQTEATEKSISLEYYQALNRANAYSDTMHMRKADIYDQLVSAYGDKFSPDAAQYAVDHITNDWESELPELSESVEADRNDAGMSSSDIQDPVSMEEAPGAVNAETYSAPETDVSVSIDTLVWLSETGEKYHRINNCGQMNPEKARQVTLEEAVRGGFGQCKNCY